MKPAIYLFIAIIALGATACKKSKQDSAVVTVDSIRWNYNPGYVQFPVRYYFKLANGKAFQDTTNQLPKATYNYNVALPVAKYEAVKELLNNVPARMLSENNYRYQSEYVDGHSYTVTAYRNGKTYNWTLEATPEKEYVAAFIDMLDAATDALKP